MKLFFVYTICVAFVYSLALNIYLRDAIQTMVIPLLDKHTKIP